MKLRKAFRFRLRPSTSERQALIRMAGARRFVWNWALAECQAHYREMGKSLSWAELSRRLTLLKRQPKTAWLCEMDSQALQQTLADLRDAYRNFFEKRARFPRFKSRKRDTARFRIPQRVKVANSKVYIPKVGWIPIRQSQLVEGETKSATFAMDVAGRWHGTLVTEFVMPDTPLPHADVATVIGVDLGLRDFAVLSNGERIAAPAFFRKAERKLRRAQRMLSRREKQSKRRLRAKHKVALLHQRIAAQRNDFLHKLTTQLVKKYEGIAIEDLNVRGFARTKLAKSIMDVSFGEFRRQLEYKTVWRRKHLAVVNRFFPSSKMCHACGAVNYALTLADRSWNCDCGARHDRDLNAAVNLRSEGLKVLAAGHAER